MLQKFLFVGVGGSGGITVRVLRSLLAARLDDARYPNGLPAAWQFVHIDVPREQGRHPEDVPLLPDHDYVGLAERGMRYRDLDAMLCRHGALAVEHAAGWRPNPQQVHVDPTVGGGRFRAVGKVVIGARMAQAHERLRRTLTALHGEETNAEFSRVCLELTGNGTPSDQPVQIVVIASLAGGSGAGCVGDVCDLLRQLEPSAESRLTAILYAPEVFNELNPNDRVGINPNALATLCELMNGYWNDEPLASHEFAFLEAAGVAVDRDMLRRGPRTMYVIGRSNGEVTFARQTDVYRAVARGLAAWTASPQIQDRFRQYELGNWADRAGGKPDTSGLATPSRECPFSSFGCASVGIGLERFTRYSAERLARSAVEHLLLGHWPRADRSRIAEEDARRQHAEVPARRFLERSGLKEDGPHNNQIVDAIRGGITDSESRQRIEVGLREPLLGDVREQWPKAGMAPDKVATRVRERLEDRWPTAFSEQRMGFLANAERWTEQLQARVVAQASRLLAQQGAPVAAQAIQIAVTELTETVVPELEGSRQSSERIVAEMPQRIRAALPASNAMLADHPQVAGAVGVALDCFHAATERLVYDLSISLIRDLADHLLAPLRHAVDDAREVLQVDLDGTAVQPSQVQAWPVSDVTVPARYQPAPNELLLEPTNAYPKMFESQICIQVNDAAFSDALAHARIEVIAGERENGERDQTVLASRGTWVPSDPRLHEAKRPSRAEFEVRISAGQLRERAQRWVRRPDSYMGQYVRQSLTDYLDADDIGGQAKADRLERFRQRLAQAVSMSRPLVAINQPADREIHPPDGTGYREEMTLFPFPPGHPGREAVSRVFARHDHEALGRLFGGSPTERIDIFSFLDAPVQPMVMHSLVNPIRGQWAQCRVQAGLAGFWTWRRARQLPSFVPCTTEVRQSIVLGWFVARFLNQIRCEHDDVLGQPTEVFSPPHGFARFPFPLLGPPLRTRDEWLPAVLESLALTLIGEGFEPYERLIRLGRTTTVPDGVRAPGELVEWIRSGRAAPGAPLPHEHMAGPAAGKPSERAGAIADNLDVYLAHYLRYERRALDPREALDVSRAWECYEDVKKALAHLQVVVAQACDRVPFDQGEPG